MEFSDVVRRRRMVRSYDSRVVEPHVLRSVLDTARRVPSAGFTQGTSLLVLHQPHETGAYWDITLPEEKRPGFPWPGLLRAPVLVIPVVDAAAYVRRYGEPDKRHTGLGDSADAWPVPYWWVDGGLAVQAVLYAAVNAGLGALFFGIFSNEAAVLQHFGVPASLRAVGTVALGYEAATTGTQEGSARTRRRREFNDFVHFGAWNP